MTCPAVIPPTAGHPSARRRTLLSVAIEVIPATAERWPDVVTVMGVRGDPSRCWCQYFRLRGRDWSDATPGSNRKALCDQVTGHGPPPGVIAYDEGEPAGWCATAPQASYPRAQASPNWRSDDTGSTWVVTCFVVRPGYRRRGLAGPLLGGAVDLAAEHGATAVEGCAVDLTAAGRMSSADLYRGPLSVFLDHGFSVVRRNSAAWVLVRKLV
jgi:GNAT superfamily N-acetyltransferase